MKTTIPIEELYLSWNEKLKKIDSLITEKNHLNSDIDSVRKKNIDDEINKIEKEKNVIDRKIQKRDYYDYSSRVHRVISSNSLFHFMKERSHLTDVIRKGFTIRYSIENHPFNNGQYAIPMKCFCDIPLSMVKEHTEKYGKYGIGVSKVFAFTHHITPVIYVHNNSKPKIWASSNCIANDENLFPYFKIYDEKKIIPKKANATRKTRNIWCYIRYYDEKEWRYIPRLNGDNFYKIHPLMDKPKEERHSFVDNLNKQLPSHQLDILYFDIRYIIIRNYADLEEIALAIDDLLKQNSKMIKDIELEKKKLISKIITISQIENDF